MLKNTVEAQGAKDERVEIAEVRNNIALPAAAGTSHCLSCYEDRSPSPPPRALRGADGHMYQHCGMPERPELYSVPVPRPRQAASIPTSPSADDVRGASPFHAQTQNT